MAASVGLLPKETGADGGRKGALMDRPPLAGSLEALFPYGNGLTGRMKALFPYGNGLAGRMKALFPYGNGLAGRMKALFPYGNFIFKPLGSLVSVWKRGAA